ncbi:hypothetical protein H9Q70_003388 [Fusarium xylarioides]|nr:hypothetical protein H9Q70_003388 [Fusarium xylarioides]KAG5785575.1 hypothetical protein H9Q73_000751 [Fusarium xylarioides]
MRTSLFYALNGALGVVAHESLAHFKIESGTEEHRSLEGCSKDGKHKWVPDPATFVFPENDYKPGNSWDLCVGTSHCAPHEALTQVSFDFKDNGIVFNFKHIDHYKYEDVAVYIERGQPPTEDSFKYNKKSDHCKAKNDYKEAKCLVPFFSLSDGGSYGDLCPLEDNGGWRLYIKVKATISHGHKKYELYSRSPDINEKYFVLSYTCAECKEYKHKKIELIEDKEEEAEAEESEEEKEYKKKKEEAEAEAEEEKKKYKKKKEEEEEEAEAEEEEKKKYKKKKKEEEEAEAEAEEEEKEKKKKYKKEEEEEEAAEAEEEEEKYYSRFILPFHQY